MMVLMKAISNTWMVSAPQEVFYPVQSHRNYAIRKAHFHEKKKGNSSRGSANAISAKFRYSRLVVIANCVLHEGWVGFFLTCFVFPFPPLTNS